MEKYIYTDRNGVTREGSKKHKYEWSCKAVVKTATEEAVKRYVGLAWTVGQAKEREFELYRALTSIPEHETVTICEKKIKKIY